MDYDLINLTVTCSDPKKQIEVKVQAQERETGEYSLVVNGEPTGKPPYSSPVAALQAATCLCQTLFMEQQEEWSTNFNARC